MESHDTCICFIKPFFKIFSSLFAISLLIRVAFVLLFASSPLQAEASLLSLLLGDDAYADTQVTITPVQAINPTLPETSGTMAILEANASSFSYGDKNTKDEAKKDENIDAEGKVNIVSDNALLPVTGHMGVSSEADAELEDYSLDQVSFYVVRNGDSLSQIAEMFNVTEDTVLSANNMKKGDKLKVDDVLLILPFSGVEYTVISGDTPQGIANRHKVNLDDMLDANDIDKDSKLAVGQKLIIPGAGLLADTKPKSIGSKVGSGGTVSPTVAGNLVNPVPGARKSRGIKPGHEGVDLAAPTGTQIRAAAAGKVLIARNGYNGGFGNYVVIQHPNGTKTLYGHMSRLGTTPGAQVAQSETIGYVGSTGRSTGPHLHFEVLGGKNPF